MTYKDYMLPAISDVPDFAYHHLRTPSQSVGGFRGVGEGGHIVGPPPLVNAIADALSPFGDIPLDLPLTPTKLLQVIEGRSLAPRPAESSPVIMPSAPLVSAAPVAVPEPQAPTPTQTRIDGTWNLLLATPISPQKFSGTFITDGDKVSGSLDSDIGSQACTGVVEGNRLRWDLKVTKPVSVTLKYDVLIEGDKLTGKVKMGIFGNAKLTGERGVKLTETW